MIVLFLGGVLIGLLLGFTILLNRCKKTNLRRVVNKNKHINADKIYWYSESPDGLGHLFTAEQLAVARKRYEKNKEDVI